MLGQDPTIATRAGGREAATQAQRAIAAGLPQGLKNRLLGSAALAGAMAVDSVAAAQGLPLPAGMSFGTFEVIQAAVFTGVMGAALVSAIWLIRERGRIASDNLDLRGRIAELSTALQRSEALLNLKDQRVVVWMKDNPKPDIVGALSLTAGVPEERAQFLAFGRWLSPRSAASLERAIADLRGAGRTFEMVAETQSGALLEVHGRTSASNAIVRFLSLSDAQKAHGRLKADHTLLASETDAIRSLLDALPLPFWLREENGRLRWVNRAFARAVEASDGDAAVRDGRELLPTNARDAIAQHHRSQNIYEQTVSTVVGGDRHLFYVTDFSAGGLSAGIATDSTEVETVREELRKVQRSHSETLDQLTTAVAIFDASEKLRFYNQAFQKLWDLEAAFLESAPANAMLLDRLRTDGKIAEQPEWRRWKDGVLAAYRAVQTQEDWWHLPDGRTLRVLATPHPTGGLTWIFENLTEKMDLESRYNAAVRVQGRRRQPLVPRRHQRGPQPRGAQTVRRRRPDGEPADPHPLRQRRAAARPETRRVGRSRTRRRAADSSACRWCAQRRAFPGWRCFARRPRSAGRRAWSAPERPRWPQRSGCASRPAFRAGLQPTVIASGTRRPRR